MTEAWSKTLKTNNSNIKYYDLYELSSEKNSKILGDISKGHVYLPIRLGSGKKIIYTTDAEMNRILSLTISTSSLQALKIHTWASVPFWKENYSSIVAAIFGTHDMPLIKTLLDAARNWVCNFARCVKSRKHLNTLKAKRPLATKHMDKLKK